MLEAIPYERRMEINDRIVNARPGAAPMKEVYRNLDLRNLYGLTWRTFERYAGQIREHSALYGLGCMGREILAVLTSKGVDRESVEKSQDLAQLMLVSRLIGCLLRPADGPEPGLTTRELCELARAFAAQRKVAVAAVKQRCENSRDRGTSDNLEEELGSDTGRLPARFREIVRQVYGVELQADVEHQPDNAEAGDQDAEPTETRSSLKTAKRSFAKAPHRRDDEAAQQRTQAGAFRKTSSRAPANASPLQSVSRKQQQD